MRVMRSRRTFNLTPVVVVGGDASGGGKDASLTGSFPSSQKAVDTTPQKDKKPKALSPQVPTEVDVVGGFQPEGPEFTKGDIEAAEANEIDQLRGLLQADFPGRLRVCRLIRSTRA